MSDLMLTKEGRIILEELFDIFFLYGSIEEYLSNEQNCTSFMDKCVNRINKEVKNEDH